MGYRKSFLEFRKHCLTVCDAGEAAKYDAWIQSLTDEDHLALLSDLEPLVQFGQGMSVLDAGAGTGALSMALVRISGIQITALEPCPAMLDRLAAKPELEGIKKVQGFCDHLDDRAQFPAGRFDVIASRQLTNSLYDPLAAFSNWHYWLRPGGIVIAMDGMFSREGWSGIWESQVDSLPLSVCGSLATVPYLLELAGFQVEFVGWMTQTNQRPSTRTRRYMVVARKSNRADGKNEDARKL